MNFFQHLVDGMSAAMQRGRASFQMTLGQLIQRLQGMRHDTMIDGIAEPHSYRGYYDDLAFERRTNPIQANAALKMACDCMGKVFTGYKGGDFVMGELTPIWMAEYGCCGQKIMDIDELGHFVLAEVND